MPAARQRTIDTSKKGPQVAHVPDTSPYPPTAGSPTSQFEPVDFAAARGGKRAGTTKHAGAPDDAAGTPSLADKASLRGHREIDFSKVRGPGVAKRSAGKKTPATTIDKGMD